MERIITLLLVIILVFVIAVLMQKGLKRFNKKTINMLLLAGLILLALWFLGMVSSYTLDGGIHILLAISVISLFIWLFDRRRVKSRG